MLFTIKLYFWQTKSKIIKVSSFVAQIKRYNWPYQACGMCDVNVCFKEQFIQPVNYLYLLVSFQPRKNGCKLMCSGVNNLDCKCRPEGKNNNARGILTSLI
jgi:hypothetical protein